MKGFRQYDYIEYTDTSVLHSELKETIKQHQFPDDTIQEVRKFLVEIMALQLEDESADEEVIYESNKNCMANDNENEDGEPDGDDLESNDDDSNDDDKFVRCYYYMQKIVKHKVL